VLKQIFRFSMGWFVVISFQAAPNTAFASPSNACAACATTDICCPRLNYYCIPQGSIEGKDHHCNLSLDC
jgi:hypothetical protein